MLEAITKTITLQSNLLLSDTFELLLPFALVVAFFGIAREIIELFEEK